MRTTLPQAVAVLFAAGAASCGGSDDGATPPPGQNGGVSSINPTAGGGAVLGGGSGTGGTSNAGGKPLGSSGGANASASGAGAIGRGGSGAFPVGGSGNVGLGGAANGGAPNNGGAATGGRGGGGTPASGGTSNGGAGVGGSSGGASNGGTSGGCNMGMTHSGGMQYCKNSIGNVGNGYSYQLWSSGQGSGCMTVFGADATFKSNWSGVQDFLARVGLGWDSSKSYDQLGTISADFAFTRMITGGLTYVGIYGWSVSPLVEYYIMEDWVGSRPTGGGSKVGTVTIPGEGTYDVYQHMQVNQPSITGNNATFPQFFSVRQTARQCGHTTISEHFKQWNDMNLKLGKMEEARILVEAINNSGSIEFTTATVVAK